MTKLISTTLALGAVLAATAAQADNASDYNLFVLGDMRSVGSDTQGRVAVGGNAYLQNYSVGATLSNPTGYSLVVGGNLTANGGSTNGNMIVGGTSSFSSWSTAGLAPSGSTLPVDFAAEAIRLKSLSTTLGNYAVNGTTSYQNWGNPAGSHSYQITFTGTAAAVNVFTLDASKMGDANTFTIDLIPGTTALINVIGSSALVNNAGMFVNGGDASDILWNFEDATNLSFKSTNMTGSVLAPLAAYTGSAPVQGQMIVGSFTGVDWNVSQINAGPYDGSLLSPPATHPGGGDSTVGGVPEPASWAMMLVGFGLLGAMMRRRRGTTLSVEG